MASGLTFPRETFAQLTPAPFLHAHLKQDPSIRPNGRATREFRELTVNVDSLTHCNGSTVVRAGDTAIVCGVRAEILLASDIPHPPSELVAEKDMVSRLGLLIPNFELSTGCSPSHLPGNPPGTLAQSLTYRIASLLQTANIVPLNALRIPYSQPANEETGEESTVVVKAYWALYIDILCIALDGNPFDTAWAAVVGALRTVKLPKAWWDPDREMILCSPSASDATQLQLTDLPVASTFAMFTTASPLKPKEQAGHWPLADPDGHEEGVCKERLTVVMSTSKPGTLLKLDKSGGRGFSARVTRECVTLAQARCDKWKAALEQ